MAGMLEVNLTASLMEKQWQNIEESSMCTTSPDLCNWIAEFIVKNSEYVAAGPETDSRWYQVRHVYVCVCR